MYLPACDQGDGSSNACTCSSWTRRIGGRGRTGRGGGRFPGELWGQGLAGSRGEEAVGRGSGVDAVHCRARARRLINRGSEASSFPSAAGFRPQPKRHWPAGRGRGRDASPLYPGRLGCVACVGRHARLGPAPKGRGGREPITRSCVPILRCDAGDSRDEPPLGGDQGAGSVLAQQVPLLTRGPTCQ